MGILRGTAKTIEVNCSAKITGDLGKSQAVKFKVTFNRRSATEYDDIVKSMHDKETDTTPQSILRDDIVSRRDMDCEGGEVEYNEENRDLALNHLEYLDALFRSWVFAQTGKQAANAPN